MKKNDNGRYRDLHDRLRMHEEALADAEKRQLTYGLKYGYKYTVVYHQHMISTLQEMIKNEERKRKSL